jgi:signal transduction histidine kinase
MTPVSGRADRELRQRTIETLIVRVRWGALGFLALQMSLYSPSTQELPFPRWPVTALLAAVLIATNVASHRLGPRLDPRRLRLLGMAETAMDLGVMLALLALFAFDPVSRLWPLLTIVIAEGAARERLRGALGTWLAAAIGIVVIDLVKIDVMSLDPGIELPGTTFSTLTLLVVAVILGSFTRELSGAREQAADHAVAMQGLSRLATQLTASRRVDRVVTEVLSAARMVSGAPRAGLILLDEGERVVIGAEPDDHFDEQALEVATAARRERRLVTSATAVAVPVRWPPASRAVLVLDGLSDSLPEASADGLALLATSAQVALDNAFRAEQEQRTIRELRELDELKDDLLSMLSHDLRSPLTSVVGFAKLLEQRWEDLTPESRHSYLQSIGRSAERMARLVDEILQSATVSESGLRLDRAPVDLEGVLAETIAQEVLTSATHDVQLDLSPSATEPLADRDRLAEVMQNLLSNAVKYSPDGGLITVSSRRRDSMVEIAVADEGLGLPANYRDQLFQRFARLHRTSGIPGTGVGLYIVRTLVEAMGGDVAAANRPGRGAVFTITLPAPPTRTRAGDAAPDGQSASPSAS